MNQALMDHAAQTIAVGSKSFAAAAKLFAPETRRSVLMLYAWCRYCDDVIDGQELGFGQQKNDRADSEKGLAFLRNETARAYAGESMEIPAFAAFQEVAIQHAIDQKYAFAHLAGFAMDVEDRRYITIDDTLSYCYHVAGVVGIMMAIIMGAQDEQTLDRACDLGLAFQLTNIARDIIDDANVNRCYLPENWLQEVGIPKAQLASPQYRERVAELAQRLVDLAESYYASSRAGFSDLPLRSAWSIATAWNVYRAIGIKVVRRGAQAWDQRVSTSTAEKLSMVLTGLGGAMTSRNEKHSPRSTSLWQRPR